MISQLLLLGAVIYLLPYRVVIRPILLNRRAGEPTQWDAVRVLRVVFVALLCGGGGWLSQILHQATVHGPTVWTIPHSLMAIALILGGLTAGLISEHLRQDHVDEAYTQNKVDGHPNSGTGQEQPAEGPKVLHLSIRIPDTAFHQSQPGAVVVIPDDMTRTSPVKVPAQDHA